jgi:hypothetical protein
LGTPTSFTTAEKKSDTFRPLLILANSHFIPFNKFNVVDTLEGSPASVNWVRTVEGEMDSSKNWASP